MVVQLLIMGAALWVSSFVVGMLPLSYAFSRNHLERLSVLGTGLLLGAALGVIIPEGLEAITEDSPKELPARRISLCLVAGFVIMLVIEQLIAPNAHAHSLDHLPIPLQKPCDPNGLSEVEFDAELGELDGNVSGHPVDIPQSASILTGEGKERAFSLLLGLVIHGIADGLALGVANLARTESGETTTASFIVFLALILHKAPTSLAFTTSILSTNLPRPDCKKYVAIFSSSTPLSAISSYLLFSVFGIGSRSDLTGSALLLSGGTFLYVATVLQPVSHHSPASGELRPASRVLLITIGMFIPLLLSAFFEHSHGH